MRLQGGLVTIGMEEGTFDTPHTFEDTLFLGHAAVSNSNFDVKWTS